MMVLPAKVFEVSDPPSLSTMMERLRDFREEEVYEGEEGKLTLITEILNLNLEEDVLSGVFCRDFVKRRYYRGRSHETPVTEEAPFWFKRFDNRVFLIILAPSVARGVKKLLTSHVANKLGEVIFGERWRIIETRIPHETLKELHESNPQATKLIWFDDIDIPGIEKLCLSGPSLADTSLYHEYLKHGKIWYVVFEVVRRGIVVGVTRDCVVTLFSKSTIENFIEYIMEDILKLIE